MTNMLTADNLGLYRHQYEHDSCGVGFVAQIRGVKRHEIIQQGLSILKNLDHRGAVGADPLMGDGAGILIQIPDQLYRSEMSKQSIDLPPPGEYGVGMVFLPQEQASRLACEQELARAVRAEGQVLLGWRDVPLDHSMPMSPTVRAHEPVIRQIFIGRGPDIRVPDALERKLYVIRKTASHAIQQLRLKHADAYFVPSMSTRTVVYKGLLLADQVGQYYLDLQDERAVSALALVHQRFSTNTFPAWPLAHPYRLIAHNGEINTVKGNFNWLRAREGVMQSAVLGADLDKLYPIVYEGQSDTATFDNCLELLVMAGYPIAHAMMMMIPEAWEQHASLQPHRRAFYEYHAAMMEPWDGPAAIAFTDGIQIGATLDRNGLRPARYLITDDDLVVLASEAGVLPIAENHIKKKWRLQPGKMLLIDLDQGRIIEDDELKDQLSFSKPYRQWIERIRIKLSELALLPEHMSELIPEPSATSYFEGHIIECQKAFGWTQEDYKFILEPMSQNGEEAVGSMGNDAPLAILSNKNKTLFSYFRQLFAQVTNPPIDAIREQMVMSLVSFIGPKPNILDINNINPPLRLELGQPILDQADMLRIRQLASSTAGKFKSYTLDITYPFSWGKAAIEAHLASLSAQAVDAIKSGYNILIVSDRSLSPERFAIPILLATSAIHQHLIKQGLRTSTGLVVETGAAREVHHFALLAGYGAEAIHPYLALAALDQSSGQADLAKKNYIKAIGKGLYKVMSKMGISTYMSYTGAQIFEALGLDQTFIDNYFTGTASQLGGLNIFDIAQEALYLHESAFKQSGLAVSKNLALSTLQLDAGGDYAFRVQGEAHLWTPEVIAKLQQATWRNDVATYEQYAKLINEQNQRYLTLRGLFALRIDPTQKIPIEEVEPAAEIVKRFCSGAMSLGSISTEAHTVLAVAMNRLGAKSNTGEGGEDPMRYQYELESATSLLPLAETLSHKNVASALSLAKRLPNADIQADIPLLASDSLRSKIKQVASARFGVTAAYLNSADQIQIKMAQGAKPGEGGQLPGHKVTPYIAQQRFSVPGVGLISPPPHHDIYSIEDLAQLIHDLKSVNHYASISVKLVSEVGVGTIAAGVAKAKADHVTIAGHDGGTGASPISSIKYAGTPWELGLAETQQTLVRNGLRSRIRVQVDGQLRTGRDVVIAALLGADEFGFATAPLVAEGCIMMRKCHLNTCPVGIATQDPLLRKKFAGKPEYIVNYFFFVAQEVRSIMAQLGIRTFNQLIGASHLLEMQAGVDHWKASKLDFSALFFRPSQSKLSEAPAHHATEQPRQDLQEVLDHQLIAASQAAFKHQQAVSVHLTLRNRDRTLGAMLSGEVVRNFGHAGLPSDTIKVICQGTAGQSFGAFLAHGITLTLSGEANDYVGKGLSGGKIVIKPHALFLDSDKDNIIVGNTVLYGAIEGEAYICGVAGERFAVRNSGALAVVEGVGDHGCEYMTAGTVVVLGETGRNFAAGMSGGVAYVWDPQAQFVQNCNLAMVDLRKVLPADEQVYEQVYQQAGDVKDHQLDHPSMVSHNHMPSLLHSILDRSGVRLALADEVILYELISRHAEYTGSVRAKKIMDTWPISREQFVKVFPKDYQQALLAEQTRLSREKLLDIQSTVLNL